MESIILSDGQRIEIDNSERTEEEKNNGGRFFYVLMWMSSPKYEFAVDIIGMLNILFIVVRQINITDSTKFITYWMMIQIVINWVFVIELIRDLIVYGLNCY